MTALDNATNKSGTPAASESVWGNGNHPFALPTAGGAANVSSPGDSTVGKPSEQQAATTSPFDGANHPYAQLASAAPVSPPGDSAVSAGSDSLPPMSVGPDAPAMPAPIEAAISKGAPIRFSSAGENQQAKREPDFFYGTDGKLTANPKATPSADGSINIQIQTQDPANNASLRSAIQHESEMQKKGAQEMIRLFQKAHPKEQVPSWMQDLVDAKPNLPDFIPFTPPPNAPVVAPPENGFVPRGVSGGGGSGGGGGGDSGFAGNGGFNNQGYFQGGGGAGDGTLQTGGIDSKGTPLGPGEKVEAKQLYDYFTEHGFSAAQASGILGNIQTESTFNTSAYNSKEGAIGLCQWEGNRRTELEAFAKQEGKPVTDWHVQADFIMHELNTTEKGAMAAIQASTTPAQAAEAFQSKYERSACLGDRASNAVHLAAEMSTPAVVASNPHHTANA